ncbi:hypothetical protein PAPH110629_19475 [Paenibacillus phoenicis]
MRRGRSETVKYTRGQWELVLLLASFFMLTGDFVVEGGLGSDRIGVFGALFDDYPVASELGDREYLKKRIGCADKATSFRPLS